VTHLTHDQDQQTRGVGAIFLRVYWMFLGNIVLALSFLGIATGDNPFGWGDVGYWFAIVTMTAARYVDITRYEGLTGTGERATVADWRKYAMGLVVGGLVAWLGAHGFAYLRAT